MSWKMMVFYHIECSKVNRTNAELRRKRGFQAIEGFGKSPVRRVASYHCRDERSSRPFPQWPAHRAGIRPMPITHESNGHHPGIQCPLDANSMPIGFRFNAHWIQIQCPLDSRMMRIAPASSAACEHNCLVWAVYSHLHALFSFAALQNGSSTFLDPQGAKYGIIYSQLRGKEDGRRNIHTSGNRGGFVQGLRTLRRSLSAPMP